MSDIDYEALISGEDISQHIPSECLSRSGYPTYSDEKCVKQESDPSAMSASFVVLTRGKNVNRHGNKVQIAETENSRGLILDQYETNPVWLFGHGSDLTLPIGKSRDSSGKLHIKKLVTRMDATIFFSQTLPEAAAIFALVNEDILRAASVSFMPLKAQFIKPDKKKKQDSGDNQVIELRQPFLDFVESELLEISVVPVGADAGAIRKSIEQGSFNGEKLTEPLKRTLAPYAEERHVQGIGMPESVTVNMSGWTISSPALTPSEQNTDDLVEKIKQAVGEILNPPEEQEEEHEEQEIHAEEENQETNIDTETEVHDSKVEFRVNSDSVKRFAKQRFQERQKAKKAAKLETALRTGITKALDAALKKASTETEALVETVGKITD